MFNFLFGSRSEFLYKYNIIFYNCFFSLILTEIMLGVGRRMSVANFLEVQEDAWSIRRYTAFIVCFIQSATSPYGAWERGWRRSAEDIEWRISWDMITSSSIVEARQICSSLPNLQSASFRAFWYEGACLTDCLKKVNLERLPGKCV